MGILKAISDALKERAKEEVIKYLKKIAEEQGKESGEKPSKPPERREERKPVSGVQADRDEERRRRDGERDRHDRFDRRDRHERDRSPYEKGDRADRWQERLERYREKYHDDFQDRSDRDEGRMRERERGREEVPFKNEEKPSIVRSEPKETPVAQKPDTSPSATLRGKPEASSSQDPVQKPVTVPVKSVVTVTRREEWIAPLNDKPIEKVQIALGTDAAPVPVDLGRMIQQLPPLEYALYLKLYFYSFSIRKNYGYVGAGLKKNIGLADLDSAEFERLLQRLEKRGLISLEKISEFQSTYVLYLPFDAERMSRVEEKKEEGKEEERASAEKASSSDAEKRAEDPRTETSAHAKPATAEKTAEKTTASTGKTSAKKVKTPQGEASKKSSRQTKEDAASKGKRKGARSSKDPESPKEPEQVSSPSEEGMVAPGAADLSMDEEQLIKSYRTFVSMEIDKAKMRVGRSNFDKIYMEAVKYIDKKYGFKVLSDQERFREYLTQYYISAFDIPSFEEWKKSKV